MGKETLSRFPIDSKDFYIVGFNNKGYDLCLIESICAGEDPYMASKAILNEMGIRPSFNVEKLESLNLEGKQKYIQELNDKYEKSKNKISFGNRRSAYWNENAIDCMKLLTREIISLKELGHRLGYPHLAGLPSHPDRLFPLDQIDILKKYAVHDIYITILLFFQLYKDWETKQGVRKFFPTVKVDHSKWPTIAQNCILSYTKGVPTTDSMELYDADNLVLSEKSQEIKDIMFSMKIKRLSKTKNRQGKEPEIICDYILENEIPDFLKKKTPKDPRTININGCNLKFGFGGMHGDSHPGIYKDAWYYDVSSYYPSILINCEIGTEPFRIATKKLYLEKIRLKKLKDPQEEVVKLILNSMIGKTKQIGAHPNFWAPNINMSICFLGQLYLVDLIEKLDFGQTIIANTDGIITKDPIPEHVLREWSERTGFNMEAKKIKLIIVKGCNSYYAEMESGEIQRKGELGTPSFKTVTPNPVIGDAVISDLLGKQSIRDYILNCPKAYDFCSFVSANKGAILMFGEKVLAGTDSRIRIYVSKGGETLTRITPKQTARVVKDSPVSLLMSIKPISEIKDDINYAWYINSAESLKESIVGKTECVTK
jgi:hypothetical protein